MHGEIAWTLGLGFNCTNSYFHSVSFVHFLWQPKRVHRKVLEFTSGSKHTDTLYMFGKKKEKGRVICNVNLFCLTSYK